jgi:hypothetical protein
MQQLRLIPLLIGDRKTILILEGFTFRESPARYHHGAVTALLFPPGGASH